MPSRVELAFTAALRDVVEQLDGSPELGEKELCSALREKIAARLDHDQTACEIEAGEFPVKLDEWPGVGRIDLLIRDPSKKPFIGIEVKCGADTLYNCVWDLAKMGVVVARGITHTAYLVAAAPATDWYGAEGSELFDSRRWTALSLKNDYEKRWEFWKTQVKTRPEAIPATIDTNVVADEHFFIGGWPWMLKAVEVTASPEDWLHMDSGMTLSRWLTHFSWKPGDLELLSPEEVQQILGDTSVE